VAVDDPTRQPREQLIRLVSKTFYRELIEYGVAKDEVLAVANHLLDNLIGGAPARPSVRPRVDLTIGSVQNRWQTERMLILDRVALRPLAPADLDHVASWVRSSSIRESFVPALPPERADVVEYFLAPSRESFAIHYEDQLVGVIGAENIDSTHRKLEMKKLVGLSQFRGRGIGTRATFLFLYHAFLIRESHKVYIHSLDTNVHNLNVNSRLGFEVEGIFLEEFNVEGRRVNVVRMALLDPIWRTLFG